MCIIAISGISGSGKSAIIRELNKKLESSMVLSFDNYDFDQQVDNYYMKMSENPDYNLLDLSVLEKDINNIRQKNNSRIILLDFPFSYENNLIGNYIDVSIFVDTPLDVALGRRIMRDYSEVEGKKILTDITYYLSNGRQNYLNYIRDIKNSADFVIDGSQDVEILAAAIYERLAKEKLL